MPAKTLTATASEINGFSEIPSTVFFTTKKAGREAITLP